ncbi:thiosulfate/3-mercaptopyruvate sulfurtransferase [Oikeobacillus pervagus]|uniref:Thiosulfate/3-mercaptopyruvate sulfurtransferase n=1 Tax=Oikeobacillus pervagus TaxID=1325931 RepID=A0AAJ1WJ01_9BACI|nr:sulfurtransferase [Oikeobacillus pervagus]MDQ0213631.1 thiosulfate/3-mercaptopyruvate sulfurtransferase [Oikeobacillus pervagus]
MKNIVSKKWLIERLKDENVRIIDCRFSLGAGDYGRQEYEKSHIPGAVFVDLEEDLSAPKQHGGRHPLPSIDRLTELFEKLGVDQEMTVVVYDDGEGAFASRCWWILHYLGHKKTYILDGGMQQWKVGGLPTESTIPSYERRKFSLSIQEDWLATLEDVKDVVFCQPSRTILIDSRAPERYRGEIEPLDRVPGHIPKAVNYFYQDGFEGVHWKSVENQKMRFKAIEPDTPIIVYCGSGVTATPNFLALKEAGFKDVRLYAGGYSDWSSYEELPVDKEE